MKEHANEDTDRLWDVMSARINTAGSPSIKDLVDEIYLLMLWGKGKVFNYHGRLTIKTVVGGVYKYEIDNKGPLIRRV